MHYAFRLKQSSLTDGCHFDVAEHTSGIHTTLPVSSATDISERHSSFKFSQLNPSMNSADSSPGWIHHTTLYVLQKHTFSFFCFDVINKFQVIYMATSVIGETLTQLNSHITEHNLPVSKRVVWTVQGLECTQPIWKFLARRPELLGKLPCKVFDFPKDVKVRQEKQSREEMKDYLRKGVQ